MATYQAPLRDIAFLLNDVLDAGRLAREIPRFSEATPDTLLALVDEAAKLIEDSVAPTNASGDREGCRWKDGEVELPAGIAPAYRAWCDAGWVSVAAPEAFGGQGLPYTLAKVLDEMLCSANVSFALYPGLTSSCFEALLARGTEAQKQLYLPKLASGEWTGTMCLTEPQAGSDLAAVKTKATPQADGSFTLDGSKIFISGGEHGLTGNIVHFVLARLPDAPPGVKGLSTFVVPKMLVNADGSLGPRNTAHCVSIEHKMGMHAACTCTMQFDGAKGWMVGAPNTGIQNMFVMMNLARILVGLQGLGLCELATQNAVRYAQERRQGRTLSGQGADVAIIEHPDVRRMLLTMKAITEGARMLAYETALHVDLAHDHPDAEVRQASADWVELNTPLVKALCTDAGFELGSLAVQVYGGHGYIREHGIEQIVRDAKVLCLYEGTNGIQAMDLVRRKVLLHGGRLPRRFFDGVRADLDAGIGPASVAAPLRVALDALEHTTAWVQETFTSEPERAAFACVDYLRAFWLTYLGWNWLRMAAAAERNSSLQLRSGKLATAQFFADRLLGQVPALLGAMSKPVEFAMGLEAEAF